MKSYKGFITEVNKRREEKLNYQYGERNKPENYLPNDPVKDALNKKLKLAQIYPAPYTNKGLIDPRSEEQRAEDRMKSVKGAGYAIKWNPTLEKGFKLP